MHYETIYCIDDILICDKNRFRLLSRTKIINIEYCEMESLNAEFSDESREPILH